MKHYTPADVADMQARAAALLDDLHEMQAEANRKARCQFCGDGCLACGGTGWVPVDAHNQPIYRR